MYIYTDNPREWQCDDSTIATQKMTLCWMYGVAAV